MPHKAKNKPASNVLLAFKLSVATQHFLTLMNQNHQVLSQFTAMELMNIGGGEWEQIHQDLLAMNFTKVGDPTMTSSHNKQSSNSDNDNVKDEVINDIPMEPPTPIQVFNEAALQTLAPSHEASTPPSPPAAVATSPAAAASISPASPCGCASYTGAVAKNLNPAAPPSFFIEVPTIPTDTSLPTMVATANKALTSTITSTSDLNIIKATLSGGLLRSTGTMSETPPRPIQPPFGLTYLIHNKAPAPPLSSATPSSSMEVWSSSRAPRCTQEPPSANGAGNGVMSWTCVATQQYGVLSVLVCTCWLTIDLSLGVAMVTPKLHPPFLLPLLMSLAHMSAPASTVAINMLQMTGTAHIGATDLTGPGSRTGPSGMPQPAKASHLPLPLHVAPSPHCVTILCIPSVGALLLPSLPLTKRTRRMTMKWSLAMSWMTMLFT
ncbi:hypothetical protein P691DRAFT_782528, partial [Macrolepiota fuliginosa MF-IS2]